MKTIRLNRQQEISRVQIQMQRALSCKTEATLTLDEWLENVALFNGLCAYCQSSVFEDLEHIVPVVNGGGTIQSNCVPACGFCNSKKGSRPDGILLTGETISDAIKRILKSLEERNITSSIELFDEQVSALIRVYPRTRQRIKILAAEHGMTMQDFIEWLATEQERREEGEMQSSSVS